MVLETVSERASMSMNSFQSINTMEAPPSEHYETVRVDQRFLGKAIIMEGLENTMDLNKKEH